MNNGKGEGDIDSAEFERTGQPSFGSALQSPSEKAVPQSTIYTQSKPAAGGNKTAIGRRGKDAVYEKTGRVAQNEERRERYT